MLFGRRASTERKDHDSYASNLGKLSRKPATSPGPRRAAGYDASVHPASDRPQRNRRHSRRRRIGLSVLHVPGEPAPAMAAREARRTGRSTRSSSPPPSPPCRRPDSPAHHRRATGPAHRTRRRRRRGRVPEEQRWPDPRAGAHQSEHPPAPRPERLPSSTTLTHAESQDEGCHRGPAGSTPRKRPRMPWPRPL